MSVDVTLLAEYSAIYPDLNDKIEELTIGIPKSLILKAASSFLAYELIDHSENSLQAISQLWFSEENEGFLKDLSKRIYRHYSNEAKKVGILCAISSLKLLQHGFEKNETKLEKSKKQLEIDLFKIYLLLNESFTSLHLRSENYINETYPAIKLSLLLLTMGFSASDLINYNYSREFFCQSVKAMFLFDYLENEPLMQTHKDYFLKKYGIVSTTEYYQRVFPFIQQIVTKEKKGFIEINIEKNSEYETHKKIFGNLSVQQYAKEDDVDFRVVRGKPLVKIDEDTYRITHPLFFTDRLYKSLYFEFSKINEEIDEKNRIKEFRSFYTTNFSEKFLFYKVIKYCLKNRYIQYSGEDIQNSYELKGAPDYYIRNGKQIFLIENKDIFINASIKENPLFEKLEIELKKKFLIENGKGVGINQIIKNIEKVLGQINVFDKAYNPNHVIIYPILVVHDIVYDCPGLNQLFNLWFQSELNLLEQKNLYIKNVKPLVVLNIDTLIRSAEILRSGNMKFSDLIEEYYKNCRLVKSTFKSYEEMKDEYTRMSLPSTEIIESYFNKNHSVLLRYNKILEFSSNGRISKN
ncbi:hypothetical protein [Parafilimonas sp.]|uniref:hypothetical protein n=1 Tax=Parafilimonas sp. TaxID=1969739 RepID=UPI0039E6691C